MHLQFLLLGLGVGAAFALLGLGLLLEFRASSVVNFAHGAVAMFVAFAFVELQDSGRLLLPLVALPHEVSLGVGPLDPWPAAVVAICYAGLLGAAMYGGVFRRLHPAPPLAKLVASVGLMLYLQAAIVLNLGADAFGSSVRTSGALLPSDPVHVFGQSVPVDRLWLLGIATAVAVALFAVFRLTRFGLATRASAESEEGAAVLGYSATTIGLANWVIASALAGLAGVLIAPISGLNPAIFSLLVVPALGAALIARLTSFSITLFAGLALGMAQTEITLLQIEHPWLPQFGMKEGVPFLAVIVALTVLGKSLPLRGALTERTPPRSAVPRRLTIHLLVGGLLIAVGLFVLPSAYRLGLIQSQIMLVLLLSLTVLTGYCGQVSLTQMAFAGVGGFLASIAAEQWGLPFPATVLVGACAASVAGVLLGLPALRSRGVHFAVLTLAAAVAFDSFFFGNPNIAGGLEGRTLPSPAIFGVDLGIRGDVASEYPRPVFGLLLLAVLLASVVAVANLRRSATGRHMLAVRAQESAASACGVDVAGTKLFAFAVSSFLAGVAGALIGYQNTTVSAEQFGIFTSLAVVALAYIGGVARISGAVLAALLLAPSGLLLVALDDLFSGLADYSTAIAGLGLVLASIVHPNGLASDLGRAANALASTLRARRALGVATEPAPDGTEAPRRALPSTPLWASVADPVLVVSDLTVAFGTQLAVDGLSLRARPGQVTGLIGPNGAGKTTTIDAITGFVAPTSGSVELGGRPVDGLDPGRRNRLGMARTFQALDLFDDLTVEENLLVAAERRSLVGRGLDVVAPWREGRAGRGVAGQLARLGLDRLADLLPSELSTSERKRVAIARALASRPNLVLLDEPAAGLDAAESQELGALLRELTADSTAVFIIDHDVELMLEISDYLYVLDFGRLIANGTAREIRGNEVVVEAYLGAEEENGQQGVRFGRATHFAALSSAGGRP